MKTPRSRNFNIRRLVAIAHKETLQVYRDPSTLLVAFVLPVVMLFIFAYALSLDTRNVRIGVVLESDSEAAQSLAAAFAGSRYFSVKPVRDRRQVDPEIVSGHLRGIVVIPQDFSSRLQRGRTDALVQIITDGTQPNTATFVTSYARGVVTNWNAARTGSGDEAQAKAITLQQRFWFNPELESRRALIPGALAIIMTMIGTLLTALVVSREWERGTMEGIFSTPATVLEILAGKLIPYFGLGLMATAVGAVLAVWEFDVPLRGSIFALLLLSSVFLIPALGQGLLISTLARNQFVAALIALISGYLPAFMLSGYLFEISSMPSGMQLITYLVPARYFNAALQTIFLAGDVWSLLFQSLGAMLLLGGVLYVLIVKKTRKSLEV